MPLTGRVALVAASSRGLGLAAASVLAREGASIVLCGRNTRSLKEAAATLQRNSIVPIFACKADLRKESDIRSLVADARKKLGLPTILVTNCGGPPPGEFDDFRDRDWDDSIDLVLKSAIRLVRGVVTGMKKTGWGRIVMIASATAKQPGPRMVVSNTLRAAILRLSRSLASELGPFGITVNAVCPGSLLTERLRELAAKSPDRSHSTS